jgi:hypothetical protein
LLRLWTAEPGEIPEAFSNPKEKSRRCAFVGNNI